MANPLANMIVICFLLLLLSDSVHGWALTRISSHAGGVVVGGSHSSNVGTTTTTTTTSSSRSSHQQRSFLAMDTETPPSVVGGAIPFSLTKRWQSSLGGGSTSTRTSTSTKIHNPTIRHNAGTNQYVSSSIQQKINTNYSEDELLQQQQQPTVTKRDVGTLPWIKKDDDEGDGDYYTSTQYKENTFLSHWNYQFSYFMDHLTNVKVNSDDTVDNLMYVECGNSAHPSQTTRMEGPQPTSTSTTTTLPQRIFTISLQSDEYRDIRMTYMHTTGAQVYRCACYPRNGDMPILGMGLMQFGSSDSAGGARNVAILDFQPLSKDSDIPFQYDALYDDELQKIRSAHPLLQHEMSNKHYNTNEKQFYSTQPIIGKWNGNDINDTSMWEQLHTAHQQCVQTHVELTQRIRTNKKKSSSLIASSTARTNDDDKDVVLRLHTSFDEFVAAREPARCILAQAFGGKDISDRIIHQVIFPLSSKGRTNEQQQQQQQS
jgi:hypothetical protein